jgi:hypothetical protein
MKALIIVMPIAIGVIDDRLLLNALFGRRQRDMDDGIGIRRSRACRDLERIETLSRIPVAHRRQMLRGFVVNQQPQIPETSLLVGNGPCYQLEEIVDRERLKLEDLRTRNQRAVDIEEWIVRCCADETQQPALNIGQQHVLLGFVETMNFVDEENGLLSGILQPVGCLGDQTPNVRHIPLHAAQPFESRPRRGSNHLRKACFSDPGRTIQDDRGNPVSLDSAAQQLAWAQNVPLTDVFFQRPRTHPCR